jgi:hypothetical protein
MITLKAHAKWKQFNHPLGGLWYHWGDLSVHVGDPKEEGHWHLSISHPYRYPTWDEIYTARYDFLPSEINAAIILPRKTEYVNIHPNCFHVHELKDAELPDGVIL